MSFKLWLENSIKISSMNSDGSMIRIVYPNGIYEYQTDYGPIVLSLVRKNRFKPGNLANELKNMVNKGHATVRRVV